MTFQPPLVLDNNNGDTAKNFPISLDIYSSNSDMTELHRLRYRAFLAAGWIKENDVGTLSDRFDGLDTTVTIGAFHKGACIGALRLAFGGTHAPPLSMPCEDEFSNEVDALIAKGDRRLVEFSRMAVEPTLSNKSFRTTLYASLIRAGMILTTASHVDVALAAVHKNVSPLLSSDVRVRSAGNVDLVCRDRRAHGIPRAEIARARRAAETTQRIFCFLAGGDRRS